ncbi:bifunctional UDP-sugar hydrolase/5'-nucleotidase [Paracoccus sp. p4-l81]|uniref:bifunctional metallophosphatase/5'-nucleotidase n=1 Tax=Paracoccus sp. p4-l81 TaxID=3342806 RepID=UPI0035B8B81E
MNRILLTSAAALGLMAGAAQADYTLHILHINDLHSRIEQINKYDSTCDAETEAKGECFGGIARVATKVNEIRDAIRAEGGNVIVLDAGDQFQGSLFYTTYKGAEVAEFMNAIGFDAMAVGNHEFDDGPEGLAGLIGAVDFPVVSGNIDVSQSNVLKGKVSDHAVIEVGGEKIGIVSALATDTPETSSPGKAVIFQDDIDSLKGDVAALQADGVTKIIAVNHVGYLRDQEIAAQVPGLAAVVGGHSHTLLSNDDDKAAGPYPTMVGDVPVVQAYAYSKYLGHLTLTFDDQGKVTKAEGAPILLDASVTPDPKLAARITEMAKPIEELRNKVVAETAAPIGADRDTCRARECEMGNLVAEAMLDRVRPQGIQIAIQNGGGLRAAIDQGPVTMGEIYSVLPFQNTLATFQLTGAEVITALENGVSQVEEGAGRFPQVAGLTFAFDAKAPAGARISDVKVRDGDGFAPIDPAATYGVVSNNYMRGGGDGYDIFETAGKNAYDFGPDLAEVLADYLAAQGPGFKPVTDGRITVK